MNVEGAASILNSTFRDPQGRLHQDGERILREIFSEHADQVIGWIKSPLAQKWIAERRLIPTTILESKRDTWLEHERIFFPTYPWEWTPGQWKTAGELTLDLCSESLESGLILKDATPLNVLFSGPSPIFVDVLSFETQDKKSPIWIAYAQFVRTFLLPIAAYVYLGWPLAAVQQRRDGYEPSDLAPWLTFRQRWTYPLRSLVAVPMLLEKKAGNEKADPLRHKREFSEEISAATLQRTLRSSRKALQSLELPEQSSRWSRYVETADHYGSEDHSAKQEFVRRCLEEIKPEKVLDVGANTGVYSRVAAKCGSDVVAWDPDVRASDLNWKRAYDEKLPILPLVADFARPTPSVGWRNGECSSLLSRAACRFDCVLMLGVLHHLLISDRIPLQEIVEQLWGITKRWAVLEWVPKDDSQFIGLCRGREELYRHLDESFFAEAMETRFSIRSRQRLPNGRTLMLAEKIG